MSVPECEYLETIDPFIFTMDQLKDGSDFARTYRWLEKLRSLSWHDVYPPAITMDELVTVAVWENSGGGLLPEQDNLLNLYESVATFKK